MLKKSLRIFLSPQGIVSFIFLNRVNVCIDLPLYFPFSVLLILISWDLLSYIFLYLPNFFFCLHLCVLYLWSIVFCLDDILSISFNEDLLMAHSFWFYLSVKGSFGYSFLSFSLLYYFGSYTFLFFSLIPILVSPKITIRRLTFKFLKNNSESLFSYQTTQGP